MLFKLSKTHKNECDTFPSQWPVWDGPNKLTSYNDINGEEIAAHIEKIYYMSEEASELYDKNENLQFGVP